MGRPKVIVTKSEIAKALQVSQGRVSQLIKAGMPVLPDGRVNQTKAVAWFRSHVRQTVKPVPRANAETACPPDASMLPQDSGAAADDPVDGPAPESYWDARRHNEVLRGERMQFDLDLDRGKFIDLAETELSWSEILTLVKTAVLSLPSRVVLRLPGDAASNRQAALAIQAECKALLHQIADTLDQEKYRLRSIAEKFKETA